jgi:hypothetical protein
MWTPVALAVSLMSVLPSAAKDSKEKSLPAPKIVHARFVYCGLGMKRPSQMKRPTQFLPGDDLVLAFDIENLSRDKRTGKVVFGMVLEFLNSKGKRIFSEENKNIEELNALGGNTFATFVTGQVGRDTKPGTYKMRLTIKDRITKKKTSTTVNSRSRKRRSV